jgi:Ni/Co efflux regulator RcnB
MIRFVLVLLASTAVAFSASAQEKAAKKKPAAKKPAASQDWGRFNSKAKGDIAKEEKRNKGK